MNLEFRNKGPYPWNAVDQTLVGEALGGLAYRHPADLKQRAEFRVGLDWVPCIKVGDPAAQVPLDGLMSRDGVSAHPHQPIQRGAAGPILNGAGMVGSLDRYSRSRRLLGRPFRTSASVQGRTSATTPCSPLTSRRHESSVGGSLDRLYCRYY